MLHYGASDEEVRGPYPGSETIPDCRRGATMATTFNVPPSEIWPWLVQMGYGRAGWYSWDRLDHGGHPSADEIHPEWQDLEVGDRLPTLPEGGAWFEVAALEPERFLALRARLDAGGRSLEASEPTPWFCTDSLWCFLLTELPGGRTRLVNSGYDASRPRVLTEPANRLFWEPAHWVMQTRQWTCLRRRVERPESA
jgi:proline iminopeptidase